ncbi:hypothetical protein P8452_66008 [Trifolium repens]|nr:hypothetical protein P8452_66008 [Trifolium repens]
MENEHGKNLAVLFDCELKASTSSQDLLCKQKHSEDDTSAETQDESESFSDIDDEELDGYLFNEQEKHHRRLMWEQQYQEFHEQQVAKEAAVEAAEKEVYEAILNNCLEDLLEAIKRYETALAALENFRKEMMQRQDQT